MKCPQRIYSYALLILACVASPALADDKAAVAKAFGAWQQALASGQPEQIVALYEPDAMLLATVNDVPITDQATRTAYFTKLMKNPKLHATVQQERIDVHGKVAVVTGTYTFAFDKDGEAQTIPARYTFVYEKHGDKWLIENHHSSKVPE